jgi:hypothetical protein
MLLELTKRHIRSTAVVALTIALTLSALAQKKPASKPQPQPAAPSRTQAAAPTDDYSGMYSFLQEGEFVQLDFQDGGVQGFVSRYGTLDSDRGAFLDHFIKTGTFQNKEVQFTTAPVHGMWFEFKGRLDRGEGKTRSDEGYYVVRGTLTEYTTDAAKKVAARNREVTLKSFPQDADEDVPSKKH